jgi:precorrin-3B synthase
MVIANPAYGFQGRKDLVSSALSPRTRGDLCPGVLRPWPADDGLLVRLRLVGGQMSGPQLRALLDVSERLGDGVVRLTARANLQVRGLASVSIEDFEETGLLPSRSHELVRNILMSPQTGHGGGRADLRPIAAELDRLLLADPALNRLPGRFLFVLDDGRGDLIDRRFDLGLVALDDERVQLRLGDDWGAVVGLRHSASWLAALAGAFVLARGSGAEAPWHLRELPHRLGSVAEPDGRLPEPIGPLPYGHVMGGIHHEIPDGVLTAACDFLDQPTLVVTPWRGIFIPDSAEQK